MSFFGSEREKKKREPQTEYVRIDTFDGYRHTSWDPYSLIQDELASINLRANVEGDHLWTSSESLQMEAAATWLTATRQTIGDDLIAVAHDGNLPQDVANIALVNYQNSRLWHQHHEEITTGGEQPMLDSNSLEIAIAWPQQDRQPISQPLFLSSYEALKHLLFFQLPALLSSFDTSLPRPADYTKYDQQMVHTIEGIQRRFQSLDEVWSDTLNPNIAPGNQAYSDVIKLIEDIIELGVEYLVPVIGNPLYKLDKKQSFAVDSTAFEASKQQPPRQPPPADQPAFDPAAHRPTPQHGIQAFEQSAFDPTAFHRQVHTSDSSIAQPSEAFDARNFVHHSDDTKDIDGTETEPTAFDPAAHTGPRRAEELPPFDPTQHKNN